MFLKSLFGFLSSSISGCMKRLGDYMIASMLLLADVHARWRGFADTPDNCKANWAFLTVCTLWSVAWSIDKM